MKFSKIEIVKGWHHEPYQQWFMHLKYNGRCFVLYIKLGMYDRHWQTFIVECNDDGEWDMHQYPFEWNTNPNRVKRTCGEVETVKQEAEQFAQTWIMEQFLQQGKFSSMKKFFATTLAAFALARTCGELIGQKNPKQEMEILHELALKELEKERPCVLLIDEYLRQMEKCAERNKQRTE